MLAKILMKNPSDKSPVQLRSQDISAIVMRPLKDHSKDLSPESNQNKDVHDKAIYV